MNEGFHDHAEFEQIVSTELANIPPGTDTTVGHAILYLCPRQVSFEQSISYTVYTWAITMGEDPPSTVAGPIPGETTLAWGKAPVAVAEGHSVPFSSGDRERTGIAMFREEVRGQRSLRNSSDRIWFTTRRNWSTGVELDVGCVLSYTIRMLVFTD